MFGLFIFPAVILILLFLQQIDTSVIIVEERIAIEYVIGVNPRIWGQGVDDLSGLGWDQRDIFHEEDNCKDFLLVDEDHIFGYFLEVYLPLYINLDCLFLEWRDVYLIVE
jgi:hypothetical protein